MADEWAVEIETNGGLELPSGVFRWSEVLAAFDKGLDEEGGGVLSAAAELKEVSDDPKLRGVKANVRVRAHARGRAEELAVTAFYAGLRRAGYDVARPGWRLLVSSDRR